MKKSMNQYIISDFMLVTKSPYLPPQWTESKENKDCKIRQKSTESSEFQY